MGIVTDFKVYVKCCEGLHKRGKTGKDVYDKVCVAEKEAREGAIKTIPRTNNGENRIPDAEKYDLPYDYRLVIQRVKDGKVFLFVGSHDDAEQWLENNRGYIWQAKSNMKRPQVSLSSVELENHKKLAEDKLENAKILKKYMDQEKELDQLVAQLKKLECKHDLTEAERQQALRQGEMLAEKQRQLADEKKIAEALEAKVDELEFKLSQREEDSVQVVSLWEKLDEKDRQLEAKSKQADDLATQMNELERKQFQTEQERQQTLRQGEKLAEVQLELVKEQRQLADEKRTTEGLAAQRDGLKCKLEQVEMDRQQALRQGKILAQKQLQLAEEQRALAEEQRQLTGEQRQLAQEKDCQENDFQRRSEGTSKLEQAILELGSEVQKLRQKVEGANVSPLPLENMWNLLKDYVKAAEVIAEAIPLGNMWNSIRGWLIRAIKFIRCQLGVIFVHEYRWHFLISIIVFVLVIALVIALLTSGSSPNNKAPVTIVPLPDGRSPNNSNPHTKVPLPTQRAEIIPGEVYRVDGQYATVRLIVKSTHDKFNWAFMINSEEDFKNPDNFTVVVEKATAGAKYKAKGESNLTQLFKKGTVLLVTGKVEKYEEKISGKARYQIKVNDPEQIKLFSISGLPIR